MQLLKAPLPPGGFTPDLQSLFEFTGAYHPATNGDMQALVSVCDVIKPAGVSAIMYPVAFHLYNVFNLIPYSHTVTVFLQSYLKNFSARYAPRKVWPILSRDDAATVGAGDWVMQTYDLDRENMRTWPGNGDYQYMGLRPKNTARWGKPVRIQNVPARGFTQGTDRTFALCAIPLREGKTDTRYLTEGEGVYRIVSAPDLPPVFAGALSLLDACLELPYYRKPELTLCIVKVHGGYGVADLQTALRFMLAILTIDNGANHIELHHAAACYEITALPIPIPSPLEQPLF